MFGRCQHVLRRTCVELTNGAGCEVKLLMPNFREMLGQASCAVWVNIMQVRKLDMLLDYYDVNDEFTDGESCLCSVLSGI